MEQWNEYLEALASKAPTPGGGSAAAVYGAIGTALGEMVGNLTSGKKKFAIYEEDVQKILARLGGARMDFIRLEKADEQAFQPLSEVYRMKAETKEEKTEKEERMEECLKEAYAEGITVIPESCCAGSDGSHGAGGQRDGRYRVSGAPRKPACGE